MVKKLYRDWKDRKEVLGYYLNSTEGYEIINEDVDLYNSETGELVLCFRKKALDYSILTPDLMNFYRRAAQPTSNRTQAAGKVFTKFYKNLPRLTKWEVNALKSIIKGKEENIDWSEEERYKEVYSTRVWKKIYITEKFFLHGWLDKFREGKIEDPVSEAQHIMKKYVGGMNVNNICDSGIIGSFERQTRHPYCRVTAFTKNNLEKFRETFPFMEQISNLYKECAPEQYKLQKEAVKEMDPKYLIGNSVYSTVTVNKNFRTAAHTDSGDYSDSFAALVCMSDTGFEGAELLFPEFNVALKFEPQDFLAGNVGKYIHGNTSKTNQDDERLSLVLYLREALITKCESCEMEMLRKQFILDRKNQPDHPLRTTERWSGVTAGMWKSEEWENYKNESKIQK